MVTLDTRGKVCPFPLVEAKNLVQTLKSGEELEILFDCTQATETIPQWAAEEGHEIVDFELLGDKFHTWVRNNSHKKMNLVKPKDYKNLILLLFNSRISHFYRS